MTEENISYADLLKILEVIKSTSQFSEIHIKVGDIEIDLSRANPEQRSSPPAAAPAPDLVNVSSPVVAVVKKPKSFGTNETSAKSEQPERAAPLQDWPANSILVRSPMVGTFYRATAPGAPPFVEVGQVVEPNSTVCIIEVMKLMSSIYAGARGTITHILASNAELVEYGQIIMVIAPQ